MTFEEMKKIVVDTLNCLEDACGVSVPDEELAKLKTVGDIYNYITAHI